MAVFFFQVRQRISFKFSLR